MSRPSVLIFVNRYLPGYKAGGPIRSVANIVEHLSGEFDFHIITLDRDSGDEAPYPHVQRGRWQPVGGAQVWYLAPDERRWRDLRRVMQSVEHDLVYLNSFFSPTFATAPLALRRLGRVPAKPVIVAPRGEFSLGAMAIRSGRKRVFLRLSRVIGLHRGVFWHASTEHERADIQREIAADAPVQVALNLASTLTEIPPTPIKTPGELKLAFLSRIGPKKNLLGALEMLAPVRGTNIEYNIYGPVSDQPYWESCEAMIRRLPEHIRVRWHGPVEHAGAAAAIGQNHIFFLPTFGENYGHVIAEALLAGCPVLLSDQTPWVQVEPRSAGWTLPLDDPAVFTERLQALAEMDESAYRPLADAAAALGRETCDNGQRIADHRSMFLQALG